MDKSIARFHIDGYVDKIIAEEPTISFRLKGADHCAVRCGPQGSSESLLCIPEEVLCGELKSGRTAILLSSVTSFCASDLNLSRTLSISTLLSLKQFHLKSRFKFQYPFTKRADGAIEVDGWETL